MMKKAILGLLLCAVCISVFSQAASENTLLWRISGKNITQPSYLFGTIHLFCADDIELSDSLKAAISKSNKVYLELDMNNIFEMVQALQKMKMRNDTTLADLLSPDEYQKVKNYFRNQRGVIPFSIIETYKPLLAASTLVQTSFDCDKTIAMEQLIMQQAKQKDVEIKGLETMAYQLSIFDSIPYGLQAKELVAFINDFSKNEKANKEFEELSNAYRNQQLDRLEALTRKEEFGIENFSDVLLYNRNANWVKKLENLLPSGTLVVAVGAGHLPGEKGIINLLRKAGYTVEPVPNNMIKKKTRET